MLPDRFEDKRGVIQDLLGPVDSVTRIDTNAGHIRGNHVHANTTQWVYVISGSLLVATDTLTADGVDHRLYGPGDLIEEKPGLPHAWKAMDDTTVLVFTKGPRSGEDYESDTVRLPEEKRLL